ncbi:MAG: hypothetical protein AAF394_00385 [Planctomycetota bacterium]
MHYQARKRVLTGGVFVLSVSTIAALVWALVWPVPDWKAKANTKPGSKSSLEAGVGKGTSSLAERAKAGTIDWSRRLRWPEEPAAQSIDKTKPEPKPAQSSRFQLLGTIIEKGHSFAMIQDHAGNVDLQPEGGVLQLSPKGTTVAEVKPKSVVLVKNNRRTEVRMAVRKTPAIMQEVPADVGAMAEEDLEAMDKEPVFNSLEEELDWLNGDDFDSEDFDDMDDSSEKKSSLAPTQEGGSR